MLINATNLVFFDSTQYPGRLVVVLETDDRHEFGLLKGPTMERAPTIEDPKLSGGGFEAFEVILKSNPKPNQVLRYHFAATSLKSGALTYPTGRELILVESDGDWSVHFAGVEVALPDYGAMVTVEGEGKSKTIQLAREVAAAKLSDLASAQSNLQKRRTPKANPKKARKSLVSSKGSV